MFEASVEMRLQSEVDHNRVVVAVNVRIHAIHPLEDLPHKAGEHLGEWNAYCDRVGLASPAAVVHVNSFPGILKRAHTKAAGEDLFVVDTALYPAHQMLNVFRSRHLCRSLEVFRILPQILEPGQLPSAELPQQLSWESVLIGCFHFRT